MIVAPDGELPVQSNRVAEPHGWWENVCRNLFLFRRAFALTCDGQSDSTNDFAQAARKRRADFQELKLIPHSSVTTPRIVRSIDTFNVLRGGEYFFMTSLSALKWLADLGN